MKQIKILKQNIRHISRMLRSKQDTSWPFYQFERNIHPETWKKHGAYLTWAQRCAENAETLEKPELYEASDDPIVRQGYALARGVRQQFQGKYRDVQNLRILVHVPPSSVSPGGYSLFTNFLTSLDYLGIPTRALEWGQSIETHLREFNPTLFMTSDHGAYLNKIDWNAVLKYRQVHALKVGLTASPEEQGNAPLHDRLDWARLHDVTFYYSFHSPEHLSSHNWYTRFFERGYRIHSIEFGANPLLYYPVPNIQRDINFVFLASSNQDKWDRYFKYLPALLSRYTGVVDGPGWSHSARWSPPPAHRYLYARAKVGINLHISDSIDWSSELNERTYILAACGVPQLLDNPKLLRDRFSDRCFFVAQNPDEYFRLFLHMIANPKETQKRALLAQQEVFARHTTFHRADDFIKRLAIDAAGSS
jgi:hypothetical protein